MKSRLILLTVLAFFSLGGITYACQPKVFQCPEGQHLIGEETCVPNPEPCPYDSDLQADNPKCVEPVPETPETPPATFVSEPLPQPVPDEPKLPAHFGK